MVVHTLKTKARTKEILKAKASTNTQGSWPRTGPRTKILSYNQGPMTKAMTTSLVKV